MAIAAAAADGCGFGRDDTGGGGGEQEDVLATVGRPRPLFCFVLFCFVLFCFVVLSLSSRRFDLIQFNLFPPFF